MPIKYQRPIGRFFTQKMHQIGAKKLPLSRQTYKPDSVLPHDAIHELTAFDGTCVVASIINLHNALPQGVKPSTHSS